jgi:NADH-quinone oxidoreductase subunit M
LTFHKFELQEEYLLWIAFFLSFASKIPMFPFHIWLPEAHVEAPTVGSVLLAGILLKLGVYGFVRFSIGLFPYASDFFYPLVYLISLIGIVYASMCAIGQTDLKRIIAYSSVAHMNLVTLGIFSLHIIGVEGAIVQSISHGFVAGGLFFLIGIIYSRYHTRLLHYYGGLVHCMPLYSIFFVLFTMANIALPGTSSFVGEFLLLLGTYVKSTGAAIFATLGVILSGAYSLWLCNRIIFGNLKINYTLRFNDLSHMEFSIMGFLTFFVIFLGIYPSVITDVIYIHSLQLLYIFK